MPGYVNRWTLAPAWIIAVSIAATLFVPRGLSVGTFVLLGIGGLVVLFTGGALVHDAEPPRSVSQILHELEAGPARSRRKS